METLTQITSTTAAFLGIAVMGGCLLDIVDFTKLSLIARGTAEQIEARKEALSSAAVVGGVLIFATIVRFIGMETIHSVMRHITVFGGLLGLSVGAVQIVRAVFIFLNSRGRSERKAEAKSILWRAVICVVAIIAIFIVLKHLG